MANLTRRDLLKQSAVLSGGVLAATGAVPSPGYSSETSSMKITGFDHFPVVIPRSEEERRRGAYDRYSVARITTTDGITGYAFGPVVPSFRDEARDYEAALARIRDLLIGKDPFAIELHLANGLIHYGVVEHALWDIIGKAAGMPVHKLLGGNKKKTKYYITMVWHGRGDQSHLTPEEQAEDILWYAEQGYNAIKIRCWRENIMDDVEIARLVIPNAPSGFRLMFDRTAEFPGWVWSYEQAYQVARGMQEAGVYWLEEPFEVGDVIKSAKLAHAMDMLIVGGEHDLGTAPFGVYMRDRVFDIVQPDAQWCGGISTVKKVSTLAQALDIPCILHGTHSLSMFGWLQANAALTNCEYQEIGLIRPRILPHEQWEPARELLDSDDLFEFDTEYLTIPQGPGLGMPVNDDALEEYRV